MGHVVKSSAITSDGEAFERRWSGRQLMRVPVIVEGANGEPIPCVIVDMSDEGIKIELDAVESLNIFTLVKVEVVGFFKSTCYVAWSHNYRAGLTLSLPVHSAVVASLARRFPAPRTDAGMTVLR